MGDTIEPIVVPEIDPTYAAYEEGRCDAVTSDRSQLVARRTTFSNPDDHVILEDVMSKEPLGPVVPLGDDQWFNVVKWVVYATIQAEELGITQANVEDLVAASDRGPGRPAPAGGVEGDLGLQSGSGSSPTGSVRTSPPWATTARSTSATWVPDAVRPRARAQQPVDRRRPALRPAVPIDRA